MAPMEDTAIIDMLQNLVNSKEAAEKRLQLLENILLKNNIYFLVFDTTEAIYYHNIPDRENLTTLNDCEYILDKKNIAHIKKLIRLSSENENIEVTLKNNLLEFTLFSIDELKGLFFLQITMPGQNRQHIQTNEKEELDTSETGLEEIQEALRFLDEIRNIDSSEKHELINKKIQEHYLVGIEKLQMTISDPIVSLCLDIIRKNLEEFMYPSGNISDLYSVLTPSEIKVAEFIRMGKTSKDIADALDIAQKTVENHRNNLRDKLGLRNKGVNLRSYLMSLINM